MDWVLTKGFTQKAIRMKRLIYILLFLPLLGISQSNKIARAVEISRQQANVGSFDSGLIINGTYGNSSDLTLGSEWTVSGGTLVFEDSDGSTTSTSLGTSGVAIHLTEGMTNVGYTLTFDCSSADNVSRFGIYYTTNGGTSTSALVSFANYADGTHEVNFTYPSGTTSSLMIIINGSSNNTDSFTFDNASLTLQ